MQQKDLLTIIIPTFNREAFLNRLLTYYSNVSFPHRFIIVDASKIEVSQSIQKKIANFKDTLQVQYEHLPGASIAKSMNYANSFLKTPYAAILPDDDLYLPSGIEACLKFLDSHSEYVSANGEAALFALKTEGPYGEFLNVSPYPLGSMEADRPSERLKNLHKNFYPNLFSIHRKEVWKDMWEPLSELQDIAFAADMGPCSLSAVAGKDAHLPDLYLLRQGHNARYLVGDFYDMVTAPYWQHSWKVFTEQIVLRLTRMEQISEKEALAVVKEGLWYYLQDAFKQQYVNRYERKSLFIEQKLNALRKRLTLSYYKRLTVKKLLNPRGSYYKDFKPFYDLVTKS